MNGNPTDGDHGTVAEMPPPVPPASPPFAGVAGPPPGEPKPKLDWAFFALGFVTPWLVGLLITAPGILGFAAGPVLASFGGLLIFGMIAGQFAAWIIGRKNGNNRLRSWGLGGLAAFLVQLAAVLLFFGACLIAFQTGGLSG